MPNQGQSSGLNNNQAVSNNGANSNKPPATSGGNSDSKKMRQMLTRRNSTERFDPSDYKGWMTGWCVEPANDANTCCMGFWVPCALYGKTTWRLRRLPKSQDVQDSSWKDKNGCNTACWVWFLLPFCSGILTAFQRSQIRGTYGIDGSTEKDCLAGICCPSCTQMQNDREIRAREGMIELRYNKKFLGWIEKNSPVTEQPGLQRPMEYNPPQQETSQPSGSVQKPPRAAGQQISDRHDSKGKSKSVPDLKLKKTGSVKNSKTAKPKPEPTPSKEEMKQKKSSSLFGSSKQKPQSGPMSEEGKHKNRGSIFGNSRRKRVSSANHAEGKHKKGSSIFGSYKPKALFTRQAVIPDVIVTHPTAEQSRNNSQGTEGPSHENGNTNRKPVGHEHKEKHSASGPHAHTLNECSNIPKRHDSKKQVNDPKQGKEHSLADCDTVDAYKQPPLRQHSLREDETLPVTSRNQHSCSSSDGPGLSYIHDFSDCHVTKAVLDYYEKEEKKAQNNTHALADCPEVTVAGRSSSHINEHSLASCSGDSSSDVRPRGGSEKSSNHNLFPKFSDRSFDIHGKTKYSDDEHSGPREHRLVSCPLVKVNVAGVAEKEHIQNHKTKTRASSSHTPPHRDEKAKGSTSEAREHRLVSCPASLTEATSPIQEHRLASCSPMVYADPADEPLASFISFVNAADDEFPHRLNSCTPLVSSSDEDIREHRLVSCASLVDGDPELREHRLASCMSVADTDDEVKQHRLASCASLVDAEPELREHRLASCPETKEPISIVQKHSLNSDPVYSVDSNSEIKEHGLESDPVSPTDPEPEFREHRLDSCPDTVVGFRRNAESSKHKEEKASSGRIPLSNNQTQQPKLGDSKRVVTPTYARHEQSEKGKGKEVAVDKRESRQKADMPRTEAKEDGEKGHNSSYLIEIQESFARDESKGKVKVPKHKFSKRHLKRHQKTIENLTNGSESTWSRSAGRTAQEALEKVLASQQDLEKVVATSIEEVRKENSRNSDQPTQDVAVQVPSLPHSESSLVISERKLQIGERRDVEKSADSQRNEARGLTGLWSKMKGSSEAKEKGHR